MRNFIFAALMTLGAAIAMPWAAQAQDDNRLTVTGQGSHATAPDMAIVHIGVTTEARTAAAALDANSASVAKLRSQIARSGIESRDVQTSGLSLSPIWDNRSNASAQRRIVGYRVSNQVTLRVRGVEQLGEVLDRLVSAGANQFNGLSFALQDPASAQDLAREAAVADAMHKARILAAAAGVTLGEVISINENGGAHPVPFAAREMAASDAVPISPGEVSYGASVTMVFRIAP